MKLTRRSVVIGAVALGLGARLLVLPSPSAGRKLLSASEIETVIALGEALFPPGNPLGVSANEVDLATAVDTLLADTLAPEVGELFRYTLEGLRVGTFLSRQCSFASLPLEKRLQVVQNWADEAVQPRRMAADALRMVLGMAFFNETRVRSATGWPGTCEREAA